MGLPVLINAHCFLLRRGHSQSMLPYDMNMCSSGQQTDETDLMNGNKALERNIYFQKALLTNAGYLQGHHRKLLHESNTIYRMQN